MKLNYRSQQIREKGFFVTDYNTKLKKKLSKKDKRGNKICGSCIKLSY